MKYVRNQEPKQITETNEVDVSHEMDKADDIEFFRTFVYNKHNKQSRETVKRMIKNTIQERSKMCENPDINIQLHFPCLILNYDLVVVFLIFGKIEQLSN